MNGQRFFTADGGPPFGGLTPDMLNAISRGERVSQYLPPGVTVVEHNAFEAPSAAVMGDLNILELPSVFPQHSYPAMQAGHFTPPPFVASAPAFAWPAPAPAPAPLFTFPAPAPTSAPPSAPLGPIPQAAYPPNSKDPFRLPDGTGFLFPSKISTVHILDAGSAPYENPNQQFHYRVFKLGSNTLIKDLIQQVVSVNEVGGKKPSSRGVIECIETGTGTWIKGGEFFIGGKKGDEEGMKKRVDKKMAEVGWDDKRGVSNPPVWLLAFKLVE